MTINPLRWGDNDRCFGPFTWAIGDSVPHWALILSSEDDGGRPCNLRITLGRATLIIRLPAIIRPYRRKVYPKWDAATIERLGRDWYWDVDKREYGVSLNQGDHFNIMYGRTGGACRSSTEEQRWSCFLPWTQWRHIRYTLCGLDGAHVWTEPKHLPWAARSEAREAALESCATVQFLVRDHDGECIVATTMIEEDEWRLGEGWFKWLSAFRRTKMKRSLDIRFSAEVGREKGSWKGGLVGTSIEMLPGELHEAAFRRYCEQEHRSKSGRYRITFAGVAPGGEATT